MVLAWLTAISIAAMPIAALASAPCPMMATPGTMATMHQAAGGAMQADCEHKPVKSCNDICAAMAGPAIDLPTALPVFNLVFIAAPAFRLPLQALVGNQPAGLDRPPRTIA